MKLSLARIGATATLVLLAACGSTDEPVTTAEDDRSSTPSTTVASSDPSCGEIWVSGETLSESYRGCLEDGEMVRLKAYGCESGQRLVTYADRYYAVLGGPVNDTGGPLRKSRDFRDAYNSCMG